MSFLLSLNDISLIFVVNAIVLFIIQELINPRYSDLNIVMDRDNLRKMGILFTVLFFITIIIKAYQILTRL
jgi:hypothetical protein